MNMDIPELSEEKIKRKIDNLRIYKDDGSSAWQKDKELIATALKQAIESGECYE